MSIPLLETFYFGRIAQIAGELGVHSQYRQYQWLCVCISSTSVDMWSYEAEVVGLTDVIAWVWNQIIQSIILCRSHGT